MSGLMSKMSSDFFSTEAGRVVKARLGFDTVLGWYERRDHDTKARDVHRALSRWLSEIRKRGRTSVSRGTWRARAQRRTVFLALICAAGTVAQSRWLFLPMVLWLWLYVTELNEDET